MSEMIQQRTPEWFRARLGMFTGSRIADLLTRGRSKADLFGQTAKTYMYQVMAERVLHPDCIDAYIDELMSGFQSRAMQWGEQQEVIAREAFAKHLGQAVHETTTTPCQAEGCEHLAASPDGITASGDVVEIKCPSLGVAMKYRTEITDAVTLKAVEPKYYWQTQAEMLCAKAAKCHFVVWQPYLMQPLHVAEIERVQDDIDAITARIREAEEFINQHQQ